MPFATSRQLFFSVVLDFLKFKMKVDKQFLLLLAGLFLNIHKSRVVKKRKPRKKRAVWVKSWLRHAHSAGHYHSLIPKLMDTTEYGYAHDFFNYMRMDSVLFIQILQRVGPRICKDVTNFRLPVSVGERLAITLRHLAAGDSYASLQYAYGVSRHTIAKLVPETCAAIIEEFGNEVLVCPTTPEGWKSVAKRYGDRWNFSHCIGAIDGKHCRIRNPPNKGSLYFNYKKYFSVILFAMVDADYKFMYIDVGAEGSCGDSTIFNDSDLMRAFAAGQLGVPPPDHMDNDDMDTPYYLAGKNIYFIFK